MSRLQHDRHGSMGFLTVPMADRIGEGRAKGSALPSPFTQAEHYRKETENDDSIASNRIYWYGSPIPWR